MGADNTTDNIATAASKDALRRETLRPERKSKEVNANNLAVGDTITVTRELKIIAIDEETADVTLEDGSEYCLSGVADGQVQWVEKIHSGAGLSPSNTASPVDELMPGDLDVLRELFKCTDHLPAGCQTILDNRCSAEALKQLSNAGIRLLSLAAIVAYAQRGFDCSRLLEASTAR